MPFQVIPRELVFYDLLDEAARNVADGSGELLALVDDLGHAEQHASRLRELEHAGDELTHRIIATLNTTFVVPIDRHDILRLAQALDDVLDHQQGVADLIELLPVEDPFPWFRKQVETLARNKAWLEAYRVARELWCLGKEAVFPAGTYWLRRFAQVSCDPPAAPA